MRKTTPIVALPALFGVALLVTACDRPQAEQVQPPPKRPHVVAVSVAQPQSVVLRTTVTGTLTAAQSVQIFNQEPGRIVDLPFREGDVVEAGAELVKLDAEVIRAQLAKAVAQRRQAQADSKRLDKLVKRKLASETEVAKARTDVALARAEEQLQNTLLSRASIRAPFSGVVSERLKQTGDVVTLHTHIMTLINPRQLTAEIGVSELLLPRLRSGDTVEVQIDALGARRFSGTIARIHPIINASTREGIVEVELDPDLQGALPGQHCRITFETELKFDLAVPSSAIARDNQGAYVYRIDEAGFARRARVTTSDGSRSLVPVLDGLAEGDQVIIKGLLGLRDGKRVRVVERDAAASDATL